MEKEIIKRRWLEPQISEIQVKVTGTGSVFKKGSSNDLLSTEEPGLVGSSITVNK